ncbi:MAG: hypothetical protein ISR75_06690 [Phycisphaerales bacterium]|nr:hypothetical protein [Planctomycetota bacterium]MBL6998106.1 hypothetical protein [Phycisphaerales bacterium]
MSDIQERLTKLEKNNKRMRIFAIGAMAVAAGMATLAATSGEPRGPDVHPYGVIITGPLSQVGPADFNSGLNAFGDLNVSGFQTFIDSYDINLNALFMNLQASQNINLMSEEVLFTNMISGESFNIFDLYNAQVQDSEQVVYNTDSIDFLTAEVDLLQMQLFKLQMQLDECCGVAACPSDLDGNGTVQVADLLELIAAWGPCS